MKSNVFVLNILKTNSEAKPNATISTKDDFKT